MDIKPEAMNDEEKALAAQGRCIRQTAYGVVSKPRGKEVAGKGHVMYCGKKATTGVHCRTCHSDIRSGNV
jgi:hypothetical protein